MHTSTYPGGGADAMIALPASRGAADEMVIVGGAPAEMPTAEPDPEPLPCRIADPDLWFAEEPADLERAKALCRTCPVRAACLQTALDNREPWGVWGGEILVAGAVVARKRPRGRPRKSATDGVAA